MATDVIERGRLTDLLVDFLSSAPTLAGIEVGDGAPPDAGGWPGTPGQGVFVPHVTVRTGTAQPEPQPQVVRGRHSTWICSYGLRSVGALRKQTDSVADQVRAAVQGFELTGPLADRWSLQQVIFPSLGAVEKDGVDENATFELTDSVNLWVARRTAT